LRWRGRDVDVDVDVDVRWGGPAAIVCLCPALAYSI